MQLNRPKLPSISKRNVEKRDLGQKYPIATKDKGSWSKKIIQGESITSLKIEMFKVFKDAKDLHRKIRMKRTSAWTNSAIKVSC